MNQWCMSSFRLPRLYRRCSGPAITCAQTIVTIVVLIVAVAVALAPTPAFAEGQSNKVVVQKGNKSQTTSETTKFDTSSLERTIRDDLKEQRDRADKEGREKAKVDEQLAEGTRELAKDTSRLADYTFWLAAITGALALIATLQLWMFLRQLKLMKRTAEDGENVAKAALTQGNLLMTAERAYVGVKHGYLRLRYLKDETRILSEVTIVNSGKTMATDVELAIPIQV